MNENTRLELQGIHHLSAVTARIRDNLAFYTGIIGLRLVKKTVNQDDTSMYHLFYADKVASPGSDLTFFDIPYAARERRGTHSITRTGMRVKSDESLGWWSTWLDEHGVKRDEISERDGRMGLDFEDPEGQRLTLVSDAGMSDSGEGHPWERSPVPAEHQIRGLGPITLSVPELGPTDAILTEVLNMRPVREYPHAENPRHRVHVYEMGAGGVSAELHVAAQPDLPPSRPGAGSVHHVAFRVPTPQEHRAWAERLDAYGVRNSSEVERYYFRSLYFREPNGILFELSTDGPGFTVDEDLEHLGERLALPPFLEPQRAQIEARLKPLAP